MSYSRVPSKNQSLKWLIRFQAYFYCWRMALSMKEREKELTSRRGRELQSSSALEEMKVQLEKMRLEYQALINTEQNERPFFLKVLYNRYISPKTGRQETYIWCHWCLRPLRPKTESWLPQFKNARG